MSHNKTSFKDWKEARRKRAFELKELGWKQGDIAQALGVSAPAVCKWLSKVNAEPGVEAWRSKPARSGPLKLTPEQLRLIPDFLSHGAEAYGFRGEVWTCARVAKVFEEEFGVTYHRGHVARLLKALDWTPQLPLERAIQRDEEAIEHWRTEVWPELKKRR
jgi:transposase